MSLIFKVPSTIYNEISEYDIAKPVQPAKPAKPPAPVKPKNYGKPYDILPINIAKPELQKQLVDSIDTEIQPIRRSWNRNKVKHVNTNAIIGFYGVVWYSIWLIQDNSENMYGIKLFMRNIVSYKKHSSFSEFLRNINIDDNEIFTEEFENAPKKPKNIEFTKIVTLEDLKKNKYVSAYGNWYGNGLFLTSFTEHLSKKIPSWKYEKGSFWNARVNLQQILKRVSTPPFMELNSILYSYGLNRASVKNNERTELNLETFYSLLKANKIENLDTPFVKKIFNESINYINNYYNDAKNTNYSLFINCIHNLVSRVSFLKQFSDIYDNLSVDQINTLMSISFIDPRRQPAKADFAINKNSKDWMNDNVPSKSAFNMLKTDHTLFRDSMSMLSQVIARKKDLKYEDRFRITTFHDFIMAEQWKLHNKDAPLPQYLIPSPIKIDTDWVFFQPNSIHQLAKWGKDVRNCVGGSYYINGIKDKRHFIVLALKNHVPTFTIQLILRNGNLEVSQIKKFANAPLTTVEVKEYEKLFSDMMKVREEQIKEEKSKLEAEQVVIGEG